MPPDMAGRDVRYAIYCASYVMFWEMPGRGSDPGQCPVGGKGHFQITNLALPMTTNETYLH